jgi:hypothetical protein
MKNKMKFLPYLVSLAVLGLATITCTLAVQPKQNAKLLVYEGFENGAGVFKRQEGCCTSSISKPVKAGSKSLKVQLGGTNTDRPERTEVKLPPFPSMSERWIGWSVYIPKSDDSRGIVTFQLIRKPGGSGRFKGYAASFQLSRKNGRFQFTRNSRGTEDKVGRSHWDAGAIPYDRWINLVLHYKGSSKSDGVCELYVDGKLKVQYRGSTEAPRDKGPIFKMGQYVGIGNRPSGVKIVYFDEFRVGDSHASLAAVSPGGSKPYFRSSSSNESSVTSNSKGGTMEKHRI